jgi:hypothetical protein
LIIRHGHIIIEKITDKQKKFRLSSRRLQILFQIDLPGEIFFPIFSSWPISDIKLYFACYFLSLI